MRPLTEEETKAVFESEPNRSDLAQCFVEEQRWPPAELANYIGKNLVHLIDRDEDDAYCFRLHRDRWVRMGDCTSWRWGW
jgi:60S ribosome subunit biogenesis protein NIP7